MKSAAFLAIVFLAAGAQAQHHHDGMAESPALSLLHSQSAGTAQDPASAPMSMTMFSLGRWSLMLHGVAFFNNVDQTGPRGRDNQFSTNWVMVSATRQIGAGALMLRGMFTLEPYTIDQRQYPLLFQTGETAFGRDTRRRRCELYEVLAAETALPLLRRAPDDASRVRETAFAVNRESFSPPRGGEGAEGG